MDSQERERLLSEIERKRSMLAGLKGLTSLVDEAIHDIDTGADQKTTENSIRTALTRLNDVYAGKPLGSDVVEVPAN